VVLARLLNKQVTIQRTTQTFDSTGDLSGSRANIATLVDMRITRNKVSAQAEEINISGDIIGSSHQAFCDPGVDIAIGDFVVDGSDKYKVRYVDGNPGGTISGEQLHHMEIFMSLVN
jgi:hypothetical protein